MSKIEFKHTEGTLDLTIPYVGYYTTTLSEKELRDVSKFKEDVTHIVRSYQRFISSAIYDNKGIILPRVDDIFLRTYFQMFKVNIDVPSLIILLNDSRPLWEKKMASELANKCSKVCVLEGHIIGNSCDVEDNLMLDLAAIYVTANSVNEMVVYDTTDLNVSTYEVRDKETVRGDNIKLNYAKLASINLFNEPEVSVPVTVISFKDEDEPKYIEDCLELLSKDEVTELEVLAQLTGDCYLTVEHLMKNEQLISLVADEIAEWNSIATDCGLISEIYSDVYSNIQRF